MLETKQDTAAHKAKVALENIDEKHRSNGAQQNWLSGQNLVTGVCSASLDRMLKHEYTKCQTWLLQVPKSRSNPYYSNCLLQPDG